eukprot:8054118-Ditylum_brightwellii.AAC.1
MQHMIAKLAWFSCHCKNDENDEPSSDLEDKDTTINRIIISLETSHAPTGSDASGREYTAPSAASAANQCCSSTP